MFIHSEGIYPRSSGKEKEKARRLDRDRPFSIPVSNFLPDLFSAITVVRA